MNDKQTMQKAKETKQWLLSFLDLIIYQTAIIGAGLAGTSTPFVSPSFRAFFSSPNGSH